MSGKAVWTFNLGLCDVCTKQNILNKYFVLCISIRANIYTNKKNRAWKFLFSCEVSHWRWFKSSFQQWTSLLDREKSTIWNETQLIFKRKIYKSQWLLILNTNAKDLQQAILCFQENNLISNVILIFKNILNISCLFSGIFYTQSTV